MYFSGFILNIANCVIAIFLFIYLVFNEECLIEIKGLFCKAALTVADGANGGGGGGQILSDFVSFWQIENFLKSA